MHRRDLLKSTCLLGAAALGGLGCGDNSEMTWITSANAQEPALPNFETTYLQPDDAEDVSALALLPSFGPIPYGASDGNIHLTYEIGVTNVSLNRVRIDKIEILDDGNRSRVLRTIEGEGVGRVMSLIAGGDDINELASSQTGTLYLDSWFPPEQPTPEILVHRISGTDLALDTPMVTVMGPRLQVRSDIAIPILQPPARGDGWVCAEACCGRSHHRRTPIILNGEIFLSQRYAIDFVQLVDGQLFSGDPFVLENWFCYGVELLAAAGGVVVSVANDLREWPIGEHGVTGKAGAAGNHVVVDMGNGMSYVYCHMQPGSVKVRVGDRVTVGQPLGLVGNSGATGAPHLHMHVISGTDIFRGQAIPWGFDRYTVTGSFPTFADLVPEDLGGPVNRVDVTPYEVRDAYPQELRVVNFRP